MMNNNDFDFRKYSSFEFNPFMELRANHVTDDRYSIEGESNGLIAWFKNIFQK